jgi:hypothetical protein
MIEVDADLESEISEYRTGRTPLDFSPRVIYSRGLPLGQFAPSSNDKMVHSTLHEEREASRLVRYARLNTFGRREWFSEFTESIKELPSSRHRYGNLIWNDLGYSQARKVAETVIHGLGNYGFLEHLDKVRSETSREFPNWNIVLFKGSDEAHQIETTNGTFTMKSHVAEMDELGEVAVSCAPDAYCQDSGTNVIRTLSGIEDQILATIENRGRSNPALVIFMVSRIEGSTFSDFPIGVVHLIIPEIQTPVPILFRPYRRLTESMPSGRY